MNEIAKHQIGENVICSLPWSIDRVTVVLPDGRKLKQRTIGRCALTGRLIIMGKRNIDVQNGYHVRRAGNCAFIEATNA
jgi:hypothetical protein